MLNLDDVEPEQKQKLENICNFLINEVKFSTKEGDITRKGQDFLCSHCHNLSWTVFTYYDKSKLWDIPFDLLETSPQVIIEDEDDFVV